MRIATRTDGGVGEFSRAKTINYRLPDNPADLSEEEGSGQTDLDQQEANGSQTNESDNNSNMSERGSQELLSS